MISRRILGLLLLVQLAAAVIACGGSGRYLPVPRAHPKPSLDDYYENKLNAAQPLEAGEFRVYALDEELRDDSAVLSALSHAASPGEQSVWSSSSRSSRYPVCPSGWPSENPGWHITSATGTPDSSTSWSSSIRCSSPMLFFPKKPVINRSGWRTPCAER